VISADTKTLLAACTMWIEGTAEAGLRKNALFLQTTPYLFVSSIYSILFSDLIILRGIEKKSQLIFICFSNLTLSHDPSSPILASISEPLPVVLDTVAFPAYRPKVPTLSIGRYHDQPDGPILPKSWVAALHVTTRGNKLLQQHQREGWPPRA
jgi:hypothetical protein